MFGVKKSWIIALSLLVGVSSSCFAVDVNACKKNLHSSIMQTVIQRTPHWRAFTGVELRDLVEVSMAFEHKKIIIESSKSDKPIMGVFQSIGETSPSDSTRDLAVFIKDQNGEIISVNLVNVLQARIEPEYLKKDFEMEFEGNENFELTPENYPASENAESFLHSKVALFYVRDWPVVMNEKIVGELVAIPEPMSGHGKTHYVIIDQQKNVHNVSPIHVGGFKILSQ